MAQEQDNSNICENTQIDQDNSTKLKLYDPSNIAEKQLLTNLNLELNEITAAPSTIYLLLDTQIDKLYGEDAHTQYSEPIVNVNGYYQVYPLIFELQKWGIDSNIEMVIFFAREELLNKVKRLLQPGDLIYTYENKLFEILDVRDDTNWQYNWFSQYCMCRRKLGDTSSLLGEYETTTNEGALDKNPEERQEGTTGGLPPPGTTQAPTPGSNWTL